MGFVNRFYRILWCACDVFSVIRREGGGGRSAVRYTDCGGQLAAHSPGCGRATAVAVECRTGEDGFVCIFIPRGNENRGSAPSSRDQATSTNCGRHPTDGFASLRRSHGRANSPPDCLLGPAFRIRPQRQKVQHRMVLDFLWLF